MNTPEVISILSQSNNTSVFVNEKGKKIERWAACIVWSDTRVSVVLNNHFLSHKWELVPEPVDFMTAVKAYSQGKVISCQSEFGERVYDPVLARNALIDNCNGSISCQEILNGKWYISSEVTNHRTT